MMNRTIRLLMPVAGMVIASAVLAGEETPEAILARKGLIRDGVTVILKDTAARNMEFQEFNQEFNRIRSRLDWLRGEKARLEREVNDAENKERNASDYETVDVEYYDQSAKETKHKSETKYTGAKESARRDADRAKDALHDFEQGHNQEEFIRLEGELGQLASRVDELKQETLRLYQAHSADPEVKSAILTYNRTHQPRLVIGPVASIEEYKMRLRAGDLALLRERGVIYHSNWKRFVVAAQHEVVLLHVKAERLEKAMTAAESRGRAGTKSKYAGLFERRERVAEELARDDGTRKRQLEALLEVLDGQIRRLPPGAAEPGAAERESAEQIARARAAFAQAVRDLRRAADASAEASRAVEADVDIQVALRGLGRPKISPHSEYQLALDYLAKVEPMIQDAP